MLEVDALPAEAPSSGFRRFRRALTGAGTGNLPPRPSAHHHLSAGLANTVITPQRYHWVRGGVFLRSALINTSGDYAITDDQIHPKRFAIFSGDYSENNLISP
jgi:hypothetical protein